MKTKYRVMVVWMALSGGCAESTAGDADGATQDDVTFYRDALPIFARACNGCHQADAAAPFDLTDADAAAPWAEAIAIATKTRTMPPLTIDASGACGSFHEARWLSDDELDVLAAWADAGAPAGDPIDAPDELGTVVAALVDPTHEVAMASEYTPTGGGADDYRCFVLDSPTTDDRLVTAYQVHPGEARIVHHVILYASTSEESDAQAEALAGADGKPGYECFGAAGIDDFAFLAGWAPGTGATRFPAGTGLPLGGGRKVIMQVHYFPGAEVLSDQTRVELSLSESVAQPAQVLPLVDLELTLQPGRDSESTVVEFVNERETPVVLRGMYPHMHKLGRSLSVERIEDSDACILDVPRWDFDNQRFYFLEQPIVANPGDVFRLTCTYDTTTVDTPVLWGEGTDDEMCLVGFYFTEG